MFYRLGLFIAFLTLALSSIAQSKEVLPLWDGKVPYCEKVEKDSHMPTITVYHPEKPNGTAIISCPGGGYSMVSMKLEGHDMAEWFNGMGITYIVLEYRLPKGNYLKPLSDIERAVTLTRTNAEKWNLKVNKIGVMGASAGGHLAATQSTQYKSPIARPDFQILLYPVITMKKQWTHKGSREQFLGKSPSTELVEMFSCEARVTKETPPAFIVLSSDDKAVPPQNSIFYYLALNRKNVSVSMFAYPTGGHGWAYKDSFKYKKEWTAELEKWLNTVIKINDTKKARLF